MDLRNIQVHDCFEQYLDIRDSSVEHENSEKSAQYKNQPRIGFDETLRIHASNQPNFAHNGDSETADQVKQDYNRIEISNSACSAPDFRMENMRANRAFPETTLNKSTSKVDSSNILSNDRPFIDSSGFKVYRSLGDIQHRNMHIQQPTDGRYANNFNSLQSSKQGKADKSLGLREPSKKRKKLNPWGEKSYAQLIEQTILNSEKKRLHLSEIYDSFKKIHQYFNYASETNTQQGWKNSVRHNLSLRPIFVRCADPKSRKSFWTLNYLENEVSGIKETDDNICKASRNAHTTRAKDANKSSSSSFLSRQIASYENSASSGLPSDLPQIQQSGPLHSSIERFSPSAYHQGVTDSFNISSSDSVEHAGESSYYVPLYNSSDASGFTEFASHYSTNDANSGRPQQQAYVPNSIKRVGSDSQLMAPHKLTDLSSSQSKPLAPMQPPLPFNSSVKSDAVPRLRRNNDTMNALPNQVVGSVSDDGKFTAYDGILQAPGRFRNDSFFWQTPQVDAAGDIDGNHNGLLNDMIKCRPYGASEQPRRYFNSQSTGKLTFFIPPHVEIGQCNKCDAILREFYAIQKSVDSKSLDACEKSAKTAEQITTTLKTKVASNVSPETPADLN
ncbi:MAG: hypothetical protein MHMPM18_000430 [Marteilia pararefringens]